MTEKVNMTKPLNFIKSLNPPNHPDYASSYNTIEIIKHKALNHQTKKTDFTDAKSFCFCKII